MDFILLMVDKNISLNSIEDIVSFGREKGMKLPSHYLTYNSLKEIIIILADEMKIIIIEEISQSPYFSISIDSSTDITKTKSVCVNIFYLYHQTPKWCYFDSLYLEKYDAKSIFYGLTSLFDQSNIDYKRKMIGFCSDGDKTLKSDQNGVFGLLKRNIPHLIGTHCLANSFNLANKTNLPKKFPIPNDIFDLVYDTYKHIYSSHTRVEELFEFQNELKEIFSNLKLRPIA